MPTKITVVKLYEKQRSPLLRYERRSPAEAGYPLGAQYLVHVGDDGMVLLPYTQAKQILDRLKPLWLSRDLPDAGACSRFNKATQQGEDMRAAQRLQTAD